MIHISKTDYGLLLSILSDWEQHFYAFGSRVKASHQKYSDLDICYLQPIPNEKLYFIKELLEQSDLTFVVDIVDYDEASKTFQRLIKADLTKLPRVELHIPQGKDDFTDKHHHFLFSLDDKYIGAIDIEITPEYHAIIRNTAIDSANQGAGYGAALMYLAHRWLQQQKIHTVKLHCPKEVTNFYSKLGYTEMPFQDDESIGTNSIDMGRFLVNN